MRQGRALFELDQEEDQSPEPRNLPSLSASSDGPVEESPEPSVTKEESWATIKSRAEADLFYFAKRILCDGMTENQNKLYAPVHRRICALLQAEEKRRLIMLLPRGSLKTSLATVAFAIWSAIRNPDLRILIISAVSGNAKAILREIREHLEGNELLRALWPHVIPANPEKESESWTRAELTLLRKRAHKEATFTALGTDAHMASKHFGLIICDDIVDEQTSRSKLQLQATIEWFKKIYGLAEDILTTRIILIGTRWHHHDLYGHLRKREGSKWENYIRKALEINALGELIPLFPWWTKEVLDEMRKEMGSFMFSANMLNEPVSDDNSAFPYDKAAFWEDFDAQGKPTTPGGLYISITVDPAISTSDDADFSAIVVCGRSASGKIYVLDWWAGKVLPAELIDQILLKINDWKPDIMGIESNSFQKMLKWKLQEAMGSSKVFCPVRELKHNNKAKEARIYALQPYFESGRLVFRKSGRDDELLNQLTFFPKYDHDDLADALAYQLEVLVIPQEEDESEEPKTYEQERVAAIQEVVRREAEKCYYERMGTYAEA